MQYLDKKVICPYYKSYSRTDKKIVCEGLVRETSVASCFRDKNDAESYFLMHCSSLDGYTRCNICKSLNRKYGFYSDSKM